MRVLLTGVTGQVGHELARSLAARGHQVLAPTRSGGDGGPVLDLALPDLLADQVVALSPDLIVNAAAYTRVDDAEREASLAERVNAAAPGALAVAAEALGIALVHYSTDYVFDGRAQTAYRESDPTGPLSVYGRTKLAGERAVAERASRHLVLRTSWVYAGRGRNFALTMCERARRAAPVRVVADQFGAPTWARSLAEVSARIIDRSVDRDAAWWLEHRGIYHACAPDYTTWFGFAQHLFGAVAGSDAAVEPIATSEWPTPAPRPAWSVLDTRLLARRFDLSLPPWRDQANAMLADAGLAGP